MARRRMTRRPMSGAKTPDELGTLLLDLRKEQFNLRFQRATGQPRAPRASSRCVARSRA